MKKVYVVYVSRSGDPYEVFALYTDKIEALTEIQMEINNNQSYIDSFKIIRYKKNKNRDFPKMIGKVVLEFEKEINKCT